MTTKEIVVPDIGDFSDVEIIEILVSVGDMINIEDPMITLESDKASMDVPSSHAGTIKEIKVSVGDKVSEGSLILLLDARMDSEQSTKPRTNTERPAGLESSKAQTPLELSNSDPVTVAPTFASTDKNEIYASPSIRRLARERNIDLTKITGTGPKGRISGEDLDVPAKQLVQQSLYTPQAGGLAAIPQIPGQDYKKFGEIEIKPLNRIQKISGPHMHRVWLNVPMVTHHDEADITELETFRKSLKVEAEKKGIRITGLVFMMKALASSLKSFPMFNASLSEDAMNLILKKYIHIGIAVDTPSGLMVPVFRDVDKKSIFELSEELGEISKKARQGKLSPTDLQGGCMSISSLGGIGGTAFTPIVNAPEVAILGLTRSQMKPIWNGMEFIPKLMQPIDLTYDHRVIDGANAARFVVHLCQNLGDLKRLLL